MTTFKTNVKHGKNAFDVELDASQPVSAFKQRLYELTGVEPSKQKLMGKAVAVKDETPWSALGLKDGYQFMLIGTAGPLPTAPKEKTVFVEDLPERARAVAERTAPAGLVNLGNTCYMNSTVQALLAVPELRSTLHDYAQQQQQQQSSGAGDVDAALTRAMGSLTSQLTSAPSAVSPLMLLSTLRTAFPQFAEEGEHGPAQQDAEECWTQLLQSIERALRQSRRALPLTISDLFGIRLSVEMTNVSDASEGKLLSTENALKVQAHIEMETRYLNQCLDGALGGQITKRGGANNLECIYQRKALFDRLPPYLAIQFVRFFWKAGADKKPGNKSKITRPIEFPFELDLYDRCTDALKARGAAVRQRIREIDNARKSGLPLPDEKSAASTTATADTSSTNTTSTSTTTTATITGGNSDAMNVDTPSTTTTTLATSTSSSSSSSLDNDAGLYELFAVVTHKGRDADGGHYVAWVRENEDTWFLFDDQKVSRVGHDEIAKLSGKGGSDWHMAYICLYRARTVASTTAAAVAAAAAKEKKGPRAVK